MTPDDARWLVAFAGIAVLIALVRVALIPANRLGISVFRPYRGDPWPVGVQEDDDARFRWTRASPTAAEEALPGDPLDRVAARPPGRHSGAAGSPRLEEIAGVDLEVQPLQGGPVHRVRR